MSDPTVEILTRHVATLQAQLAGADTSILYLVQAVELLDRSVHLLEDADPATTSR